MDVCHDMTSHPDMLTNKELDSVTAAFKSLESGLRGATIKQEVDKIFSKSLTNALPYIEFTKGNVDCWIEPFRPRVCGHS